MIDALLAGGWFFVLAVGLAVAIGLHALGLARTYVRDLVHVGAGVWVLGFPFWRTRVVPIVIPFAAVVAIALAPNDRLRRAMSDGDERWSGVLLYTIAFAVFTCLAFVDRPFPAAAALLALSLGDGLGGLVGRRFGTHFFRAPGGKRKSLEGSLTVAVMSALGVLVASRWLGVHASITTIIGAGLVAAVAEGASPRGTDNAIVPAAVWIVLRAIGT